MLDAKFNFLGIDYGSKLAGTTVICYSINNVLHCEQSVRKQDADQWLSDNINKLNPDIVFIDAPLSLPSVYLSSGNDFFYRKADRECGAMSPMFLGGLTARAMRLKFEHSNYQFIECYPGGLARKVLRLSESYNKKKPYNELVLDELTHLFPQFAWPGIDNWHQFDACLCWLTGYRYMNKQAIVIGDPEEGQIYI